MSSPLVSRFPLNFQWQTLDPFLFCVHHYDTYPQGDGRLGPEATLAGRSIGQDFEGRDGWRMYHGDKVPGFPSHPHRGFETITIVLKGLVDHADSLGAAGRYGAGDVQWMTAGKGVQHSEMFPLLHQDRDNPLELFQIWLNLPAAAKMAEPHYRMFWNEELPRYHTNDDAGKRISVDVVAGDLSGVAALEPPPESWAAQRENHVAVWLIEMEPGALWQLPAAVPGLKRCLYLYQGADLDLGGENLAVGHGAELRSDQAVTLQAGEKGAFLLLLQGKPIAEPVAHYGPFVMNSREELEQAFADYRRTLFGGWPWPRQDQVFDQQQRFARYADGREEKP